MSKPSSSSSLSAASVSVAPRVLRRRARTFSRAAVSMVTLSALAVNAVLPVAALAQQGALPLPQQTPTTPPPSRNVPPIPGQTPNRPTVPNTVPNPPNPNDPVGPLPNVPPKDGSDPRAPIQNVGNPVILSSPDTRDSNSTIYYTTLGRRNVDRVEGQAPNADYRRGVGNRSALYRTTPLPNFAYNFFDYPRELILARRGFLRRYYDNNNPNIPLGTDAATRTTQNPNNGAAGQAAGAYPGDNGGFNQGQFGQGQPGQFGQPGQQQVPNVYQNGQGGNGVTSPYAPLPQNNGVGFPAPVTQPGQYPPPPGNNAPYQQNGGAGQMQGQQPGQPNQQYPYAPYGQPLAMGRNGTLPPVYAPAPGTNNNGGASYGAYGSQGAYTGQPGQINPGSGQATGQPYGQPNQYGQYQNNQQFQGQYPQGGQYNGQPLPQGQFQTGQTPFNPNFNNGGAAGQAGYSISQAIDAFREFGDPLSQLTRNVAASVPATYTLAPGDQVTVRFASPTRASQTLNAVVDSTGGVSIEGLGRVPLAGQTLARAERVLTQRFGFLYRNVDVQLSLKELRTIAVTVTGEAFSPGTYVVPAVATAFNVLYSAGGPTEEGTLRRIEVRRRGALVGTLDFYKFVTGGGLTDIALQAGDVINVAPRLGRVTVDGEVRRPAVFELKANESLRDALRFAGDIKASGVSQRVQISTFDPGNARILRDVDVKNVAQATAPLYDGAIVEVFSLRNTLANQVTIEGAVENPGDYALTPGLTVAALVERARGTLPETLPTRADLYRWKPDNTRDLIRIDLDAALKGNPSANIVLSRWDRLKLYALDEVAWTGRREVTVRGAVQRPGIYDRTDNMKVSDLLLLAGGPTPEAYFQRAYLLHQRPDGTFAYNEINLAQAGKGDPRADVAIEDNDVLAVYRNGEAQFPTENVVSIRGDVVSPGVYPRGAAMKLSDLLNIAGGFRPSAGRRVVVAHARGAQDGGRSNVKTVNGKPADNTVVTEQTIVEFDSRGLISSGADITLLDGDVATIQGVGGFKERVEVITLGGAVNRPGPIVLTSNKMRLSDAIREAGGLRSEAYPLGTEFYRQPAFLASAGQKSLAQIISNLNDVLNRDQFQRELAKSDIERIRAIGAAVSSGTASSQSPLSGLVGGSGGAASSGAATAANAAAASQAISASGKELAGRDTVSQPRVLGADDLEPNGNIAINVARAIKNPGGEDDILLVDGDKITIPEQPSTVQIIGAVFNARAVQYRDGESVDYYVQRAGGFTNDAARDRIMVVSYGGGLLPAAKVRTLKQGDLILVPTKVLADKISSGKGNDLNTIISTLVGGAISIRVLDSLFK